MWQDVKQALRGLGRAPAFTLASVVTLALGIGGTTAIFSVANALFFRALPYPEADRLLVLTPDGGGAVSGRVLHHVRDGARSFEAIAARGGGAGWNLVAGGEAEYVESGRVSDGYFELLGVSPLLGREFTPVEARPEGPQAALLSEALWRRRFGARRGVIGQVVELGGVPHTVVGVIPDGAEVTTSPDIWTSLQVSPRDGGRNYTVLGRLRRGVSPAQAQSELEILRLEVTRELGVDEARETWNPLVWTSYREALVRGDRTQVLVLLGAVGFLLAIACANVAGLQLARGVGRRREMATRLALGGGRRQLVRLLLAESVLLGLGGGLLGLLVTRLVMRGASLLASRGGAFGAPELDGRVLFVAMVISIGAGLLFGLAPALDGSRQDLRSALGEGGLRHSASRQTTWLRRGFVIAQVALAVVLLAGAGVLVRTFVGLRNVPLGFDPDDVVTAAMSLRGSSRQGGTQTVRFFEQTLARIRALPGVEAAAVGTGLPVERGLNLGLEPPAGGIVDEPSAVDWRYVTPEYFAVFGIQLRRGRIFDERDTANGAPVALVNEAFGRIYFGRRDVVGESVRLRPRYDESPARRIVGVVADVKSASGSEWTSGPNALAAAAPPIMYVPLAQVSESLQTFVHGFFPVQWALRARGSGLGLVPALRDIVRAAEPTLPFIEFRPMNDIVASEIQAERDRMMLVGLFALLAMVLAGVGIYGLIAYGVGHRAQEVGVRMALGATAGAVVGRFLKEGVLLALAGVALGLAAAALLSRALESFVWGVEPLDPLTYLVVAMLLLAIAALASLAPAQRAARVDPTVALRQE